MHMLAIPAPFAPPHAGMQARPASSSLLPPPLQAGLFSAIGWGLYTLSYETLGLDGLPFHPSIATWETAKLWLPAHVLGIGLWLASRRTSSPALFPGFVVGVTVMCVPHPLYGHAQSPRLRARAPVTTACREAPPTAVAPMPALYSRDCHAGRTPFGWARGPR